MPLDPMIANPTPVKMPNQMEMMGGFLQNALIIDKMNESQRERQDIEAANAMYRQHMRPDGTFDAPGFKYGMAQANRGGALPAWEKTQGEIAKLGSEAEGIDTRSVEQEMKTFQTIVKSVSPDPAHGPAQYRDAVAMLAKGPAMSRYLTTRGVSPDEFLQRAEAQLQQAVGAGQWERLYKSVVLSPDAATEQKYVTVNRGDTQDVVSMPSHGFGPATPKTVYSGTVKEKPSSRFIPTSNGDGTVTWNRVTPGMTTTPPATPHWATDYNPDGTVKHVTVKPGDVTHPAPKESPDAKAMRVERTKRAEAAALIAGEIAKLGGGRPVISPGTGEIEIQGAQPMSPVAQRRMDNLAVGLGGYLEMMPGQNPRIVIPPGTTAAQVQAKINAQIKEKNNLTWERGANGVRRMVPKAPGVIQQPIAEKKESPVKLRAKARASALAWAKQTMTTDEREIERMTDVFYNDYLRRPGAGYGGPSLRDSLRDSGLLD